MHTNLLIALSGKIGSGKDTVASIMSEVFMTNHGQHLETRRFAAKLKRFVADIIGCPVEKLDDQDFKKSYLGPEWNYFKAVGESEEGYGFPRLKKEQMTVREMLIRIGDGMRNIVHEDIWVNALFADYKDYQYLFYEGNYSQHCIKCKQYFVAAKQQFVCKECSKKIFTPNWIIPDMRYINEKTRIEKLGGVAIRINRKDCQYIDHISEIGLDNERFSYVIDNNGSLEDLAEQVKQIAYDIQRTKRIY